MCRAHNSAAAAAAAVRAAHAQAGRVEYADFGRSNFTPYRGTQRRRLGKAKEPLPPDDSSVGIMPESEFASTGPAYKPFGSGVSRFTKTDSCPVPRGCANRHPWPDREGLKGTDSHGPGYCQPNLNRPRTAPHKNPGYPPFNSGVRAVLKMRPATAGGTVSLKRQGSNWRREQQRAKSAPHGKHKHPWMGSRSPRFK